jgi:hypothetical protein
MKCLDCLLLVCNVGQMEERSILGTHSAYGQYKATSLMLVLQNVHVHAATIYVRTHYFT